MKTISTLIVTLLCIVAVSYVSAVQLEGFNYATDGEAQAEWVVGGNDSGMGGSATVTTSLTEKKEGISSVKFDYSYSGNQWYEMSMMKTLTAPIDLSAVKKFTMWVYMDGTASADLLWYIRFYTSNGYTWRYVDWNVYNQTGWMQMTFAPDDMETDRWVYGASGSFLDCPVINEVTKIQIILQQRDGVSVAGTATYYFDDLQYETTNPNIADDTIEDFNYTDTPSLQAVWSTFAPAGFSIAISRTDQSQEGSASMEIAYHIENYWQNVVCTKTFDTNVDMSLIDYFKIWVYGDPAIAVEKPVMLFTLEDANVNRVWAHLRSGLKEAKWVCYYIPFAIDPGDGSALFKQDAWDGGGDCDISQIKKIGLFTQGSESGHAYDFTVRVDLITKGYTYSTDAQHSWELYE